MRILALAVFCGLTLSVFLTPSAHAQEGLVAYKALAPKVAIKAATAAMDKCNADGYQVAVAVVTREGTLQALVRDRFAGAHTPETARRKAWTAVSFRSNTSELATSSGPSAPNSGVRHVTDALMLGGGLMIEADGSLVGGIGVSGAPGGDIDDACAAAGIEAIGDDLF